MKLERSKLLLFALVLLLVAVGGAAVGNLPTSVQEFETCVNVTWNEWEHVDRGLCTGQQMEFVCDPLDILNTSCREELRNYTYGCTEMHWVQKSRTDCRTDGFLVNNKVKLNTEEYECSGQNIAGKVVMTCDSRLDGNGDGVCTPGESCMEFTIDWTAVTKKEKNSRDDFVADDDSYFAKEATAEVLP